MHWLDRTARPVLGRIKLFSSGWGNEALLAKLSEPAPTEVEASPRLDVTLSAAVKLAGVAVQTGRFVSPAAELIAPFGSPRAVFELLMPAGRAPEDTPITIMLASAGEEGFNRRRLLAWPMVRSGIGALILEQPWYGERRPAGQKGAQIRTFVEQLAMGRSVVREAKALASWLRARGHRRIAISGYSMGGYSAALAATRVEFPVAAVPCAAGLSPAPVYTEGVLSACVDWSALGRDARERIGRILGQVEDYFVRARRPEVAILVAPRADGFVPPAQVEKLCAVWSGAELRWVEGGHLSGYVRAQSPMRRAIADALARLSTT